MGNKGLLIAFGILIAVAAVGGVYVFLAGGEKPAKIPVAPPSPTPIESQSPTTESGVLELEVSGAEYSFNPATLTVNKGDKVRLTFKNEGRLPHNLTVDQLSVKTNTIAGGEKETVEFTADKSGTFAMYCSVGTHRQLGMEGKVEIK